MRSWKSTITGIVTIVAAIAAAVKQYLATSTLPDISLLIGAIASGLGLIAARDNGVTSEQAGAK